MKMASQPFRNEGGQRRGFALSFPLGRDKPSIKRLNTAVLHQVKARSENHLAQHDFSHASGAKLKIQHNLMECHE